MLATQNPIEQEGTYSLPEAQVDPFMLKLRTGYPGFRGSASEEVQCTAFPAALGRALSSTRGKCSRNT